MDLSDISIIKLLPPNLASDKNIRMACEAFDETLRRMIVDIPEIGIIPNLVRKQITDNLLLDLLAWQFHCDFYSTDFSIEKKQEVILKSLDWHTRKGTPSVVEEIVSTVFSRAEVQEWFDYAGLPYHFRISTEEELPDEETRRNFYRAINSVKNTRSSLEKVTTLVYLEDEVNITDDLELNIRHVGFKDHIRKRLKFNGAIKFDGVTLNKTIPVRAKFNGENTFDGSIDFSGIKDIGVPEQYRIPPPFKFSSGIVDTLSLAVGDLSYEDTQRAPLLFDGSVKFDGGSKFNGISLRSINDSFGAIQLAHTLIDETPPITDIIETKIVADMEDNTRKEVKFNGKIKFNGEFQFTDDYATQLAMDISNNAMSDEFEASDEAFVGIRKHRYFNGAYQFDGTIKFNSKVLIPVG